MCVHGLHCTTIFKFTNAFSTTSTTSLYGKIVKIGHLCGRFLFHASYICLLARMPFRTWMHIAHMYVWYVTCISAELQATRTSYRNAIKMVLTGNSHCIRNFEQPATWPEVWTRIIEALRCCQWNALSDRICVSAMCECVCILLLVFIRTYLHVTTTIFSMTHIQHLQFSTIL